MTRVLILGAAGRDFHNFNTVYRDDPGVRVVASTQAQIPRLSDRRHPASLAGDVVRSGRMTPRRCRGRRAIVDSRASAAPEVREGFAKYPHIGLVPPAAGYDAGQLQELRETINRAVADVVVAATPLDLAALIALEKPVVRARYDFGDAGEPTLGSLVNAFLERSDAARVRSW